MGFPPNFNYGSHEVPYKTGLICNNCCRESSGNFVKAGDICSLCEDGVLIKIKEEKTNEWNHRLGAILKNNKEEE